MSLIRVFLADDHPPLRMGLRVLLEQARDMHVIGESGNGHDALRQIQALCPDIAVIDCQLPDLEGVQVAAEIKRRGIPTRVLALSSFAEERYVRGMLDADAVGYLLKEEAPERIVEAVRAAARGESTFSAKMIAEWSQGKRPYNLSEREILILRLLGSGKPNKEIAVELGNSEKTVEKYLAELFKKLGVATRVEAAVKAVREGLV
ncbi:response regulator transcription factor [Anaerolineae bacterium CFX7]|nr:response regulator transcription factor [Anaerolineae bacterium CFX7]